MSALGCVYIHILDCVLVGILIIVGRRSMAATDIVGLRAQHGANRLTNAFLIHFHNNYV